MTIRGDGMNMHATEKRMQDQPEQSPALSRNVAAWVERRAEQRATPFALVGGIKPHPGENEPHYRARVENLRLAADRARMLDAWDHKREGTPETHDHASRQVQGAIARMFQDGHIDADQLGWAAEIASVAEGIERDVGVRSASLEMKVDCSGSGKNVLVEGIMRVRREIAYGWWRQRIPHPRPAVLDMLIGEQISYSRAARRWRMGKSRARMILIDSIDLWPEAMDHAERTVDDGDLAAAHAGLMGG